MNRILRTRLKETTLTPFVGRPIGTAEEIGKGGGVGIKGPGTDILAAYVDGEDYVVQTWFSNSTFVFGASPRDRQVVEVRGGEGPVAFGERFTLSGYVPDSGIGKVVGTGQLRLRPIDGIIGGYLVASLEDS